MHVQGETRQGCPAYPGQVASYILRVGQLFVRVSLRLKQFFLHSAIIFRCALCTMRYAIEPANSSTSSVKRVTILPGSHSLSGLFP